MNLYDYAEERHISPRRLIDFTLCANPLGPSNKARTAMRKVVREVGVIPDEKERYLRRLLSRKMEIPEDSILFGHGSSHILSLYAQVVRPEAVTLFRPFCRPRASLLEKLAIRCDEVTLVSNENGFAMDAERLVSQAAAGKTLLLMNPHDPSGATVSMGLIDELLKAVDQSGGMLVIDEALIEYAGLESAAGRAVHSSHCLVLRSFSFFHALAGLRIGYGIGHPSLVSRLGNNRVPGSVNSMALAAARASVADKAFYTRTANYLAGEKAYVLDKLKSLAGLTVRDTPCNFVLVGLEDRSRNLADMLLQRSILIDTFHDAEKRVWMRVPMGKRPQNARLVKTIRYLLSPQKTD